MATRTLTVTFETPDDAHLPAWTMARLLNRIGGKLVDGEREGGFEEALASGSPFRGTFGNVTVALRVVRDLTVRYRLEGA
jgi:hypothetical protein